MPDEMSVRMAGKQVSYFSIFGRDLARKLLAVVRRTNPKP
jgi:hypothetical protein